jgi:iron complex transport system substrate-binding protein
MRRVVLFLFVMVLFAGCSPAPSTSVELFDEVVLKPRYAKGFEIRKKDSSLQVLLTSPGRAPRIVYLPSKTTRVGCLSTTHLAMFQALGEMARVKAVGYAHLIGDSSLQADMRTHGIVNLTTGDAVDHEILLAVKPDLMLTYPFQSSGESLYQKQGITVLPVAEYLEEHPLGRAEWIRLIGLLCGQQDKADSVFRAIETRYEAIRQKVTHHFSHDMVPTEVMFTSYESGQWHAPPGNSAVAVLLSDAGFSYLFADRRAAGNIPLDREELIALGNRIHWWGAVVRTTDDPDFDLLHNEYPAFSGMAAFRSRTGFFCNSARSDYFGKALLEPDVLLADLAAVLYPDDFPDHRAVYFHRMS